MDKLPEPPIALKILSREYHRILDEIKVARDAFLALSEDEQDATEDAYRAGQNQREDAVAELKKAMKGISPPRWPC